MVALARRVLRRPRDPSRVQHRFLQRPAGPMVVRWRHQEHLSLRRYQGSPPRASTARISPVYVQSSIMEIARKPTSRTVWVARAGRSWQCCWTWARTTSTSCSHRRTTRRAPKWPATSRKPTSGSGLPRHMPIIRSSGRDPLGRRYYNIVNIRILY